MVYAVDIDGTLCIDQHGWLEYEKAVPILENIEKINRLYDEGNTIIIFTARYSEGTVVTVEWLNKHGVKYHEIVFDKVIANCYIDNDSKKMEEVS